MLVYQRVTRRNVDFKWFYPEEMRSSPEKSGDFSQQKDDFDGFYHINCSVG
jgi:hypothetical protein